MSEQSAADIIADKVAEALQPHLGHQEYLGDAVWRCPCGEVWSDGKHLAEAAIAAHLEALKEANTIRTVEELDALVGDQRSMTGPLIRCGGIKFTDEGVVGLGGVFEGNDDGTWNDYGGGRDVPAEDVPLPALLIWHPRMDADAAREADNA